MAALRSVAEWIRDDAELPRVLRELSIIQPHIQKNANKQSHIAATCQLVLSRSYYEEMPRLGLLSPDDGFKMN